MGSARTWLLCLLLSAHWPVGAQGTEEAQGAERARVLVESFEERIPLQGVCQGCQGRVLSWLATEDPHEGNHSAGLSYEVTEGRGEVALEGEVPLPGQVETLHLWVRGDASDKPLHALLVDAKSAGFSLPLGCLDFAGWRELSVPVPSQASSGGPIRLTHLILSEVEAGSAGVVYFDELAVTTRLRPNEQFTLELFPDGPSLVFEPAKPVRAVLCGNNRLDRSIAAEVSWQVADYRGVTVASGKTTLQIPSASWDEVTLNLPLKRTGFYSLAVRAWQPGLEGAVSALMPLAVLRLPKGRLLHVDPFEGETVPLPPPLDDKGAAVERFAQTLITALASGRLQVAAPSVPSEAVTPSTTTPTGEEEPPAMDLPSPVESEGSQSDATPRAHASPGEAPEEHPGGNWSMNVPEHQAAWEEREEGPFQEPPEGHYPREDEETTLEGIEETPGRQELPPFLEEPYLPPTETTWPPQIETWPPAKRTRPKWSAADLGPAPTAAEVAREIVAQELGGFHFAASVGVGASVAYRFEKDEQAVIAVWSTAGETSLGARTDAERLTVIDLMGNRADRQVRAGAVVLPVEAAPRFIRLPRKATFRLIPILAVRSEQPVQAMQGRATPVALTLQLPSSGLTVGSLAIEGPMGWQVEVQRLPTSGRVPASEQILLTLTAPTDASPGDYSVGIALETGEPMAPPVHLVIPVRLLLP